MGNEEDYVCPFYLVSCDSLGEMGNFVSVALVPSFGSSWIVDEFM